MDYSNLFLELENNISNNIDVVEEKNCCDNTEIILDNYIYVCKNCGIVNETKKNLDNEFTKNSGFINDIFEPSKSTNFYIRGNNFSLKKLNKWMNYNSQEVEANKCYKIIKKMLEKIKKEIIFHNKIFNKVLHQSKLYWKSLYFDKKIKTRGKPRECLFLFCIVRSLIFLEIKFNLLELLELLDIDFSKYNKALKKIQDNEKRFINTEFIKYLDIINKYNENIDIFILINKYNHYKKIKIKKLKSKILFNINDTSILKTISYNYIKGYISKQESYSLLNISPYTLNKSLKFIY